MNADGGALDERGDELRTMEMFWREKAYRSSWIWRDRLDLDVEEDETASFRAHGVISFDADLRGDAFSESGGGDGE